MQYTRKNRRLKARLRSKAQTIMQSKKDGLFLSPVEVRMIECLGGKVATIERDNKRPLTIVYRKPKLLKREHFTRTGDKLLMYSNDLKMGIAIKGHEYSRDVIGSWERDQKLQEAGYRITYIPLEWLRDRKADLVQQKVQSFIYA